MVRRSLVIKEVCQTFPNHWPWYKCRTLRVRLRFSVPERTQMVPCGGDHPAGRHPGTSTASTMT